MNIAFFGTPFFAAEILRFLLENRVSVSVVITQPDRPKGRSLQLTPSPVKEIALEKNIPVLQPEKASQESFLQQLATYQADLFVVVAFGQILSQKLLDLPPLGCINIHASLLPKWRGAAPIQRAIQAGDTETGIAIQKMVRQLDAGDIIATVKTPIPPDMNAGELEKKLNELAKPLLLQVLKEFEKRIPPGEPQNHELATYASKIELEEGEIDWKKPAQEIHHLIRAFSPKPGAWCWILVGQEKRRLKILRANPISGLPEHGKPGLQAQGTISCGTGALQLLEVQPEGKKAMAASEWLRGQKNISFIVN